MAVAAAKSSSREVQAAWWRSVQPLLVVFDHTEPRLFEPEQVVVVREEPEDVPLLDMIDAIGANR
ncbi:MAG: hypothetical protein M3R26_03010 [Actinomycetota bacterium]|nr:hypothetical protein [Actinomycetota bacterium]MDQ2981279.1 hypothetical protein [Actinomycetota bacterium]